jgi:hypothetical protein
MQEKRISGEGYGFILGLETGYYTNSADTTYRNTERSLLYNGLLFLSEPN